MTKEKHSYSGIAIALFITTFIFLTANLHAQTNFVLTEDINGTISTMASGGFAGRISANIAYCYAKGDVSIRSSNMVYAGGFAGYLQGGSVSFCYSTGNVSIIRSTSTSNVVAGGFCGQGTGITSHCYALGNVYFNGSGNMYIFAGGFSGYITNSLNNCFSAGMVIAHLNNNPGNIYVGGLLGYATNNTVQNCVVAVLPNNLNNGMSFIATGGGNRYIGRIYGIKASSTTQSNYAYNGIRLYSDSSYDTANPSADTSMTATTKVDTGKDGADASSGYFRTRSNWTDLGFAETVNTTINGVTDDYPAWSFNGIEGRGYPLLKNADGKILGGQN